MDLIEKTENLKRHPWELSRSSNILQLLEKRNDFVYADIGAGDSFFASKLVSITKEKVFAIDTEYKNSRAEQNGIVYLNDLSLIKKNSIDCLIMMDVLEHIEYEKSFLIEVLDKLKSNGRLIITVPAMQFLFSSHDIFLKHYRRYNRKKLLNLLGNHGIVVEQSFYFYSILFLFRCISLLLEKTKLVERKKNVGIGLWAYNESSFVTRSISLILNIDFAINKLLNKVCIRLPGLSLLAVCRKNS